jgi:hypothetical protein
VVEARLKAIEAALASTTDPQRARELRQEQAKLNAYRNPFLKRAKWREQQSKAYRRDITTRGQRLSGSFHSKR